MGIDPYLSDLMRLHGFSIQSMETVTDAASTWGDMRHSTVGFDVSGRRREVALVMRRDLVCEVCAESFGITFRVAAECVVSRGQRVWDGAAVTPALECELRRRVRCPHCQAIQQGDRRAFRRREWRHSLVGLAALGGTIIGSGVLSSGGYVLAGSWGLAAGLVGSLFLVLTLTRWMLTQLLEPVTRR